jgi:hypothetical protein
LAVDAFRIHELLTGFGNDEGGVFVSGSDAGDTNGVAGFEKLKRSFAVDAEDGVLNMCVGGGISAAAYEIIFGFDVFATGVDEWRALHYHHVAGCGHGEVGLGG